MKRLFVGAIALLFLTATGMNCEETNTFKQSFEEYRQKTIAS